MHAIFKFATCDEDGSVSGLSRGEVFRSAPIACTHRRQSVQARGSNDALRGKLNASKATTMDAKTLLCGHIGCGQPAARVDTRIRVLRSWIETIVVSVLALCLSSAYARAADSPGKEDYLANCARCHGDDGKGAVPAMRAAPGYTAVDLTALSSAHDGRFPRQEVYDAIDGRKHFPAHLVGDMPVWGLKFRGERNGPAEDRNVSAKIQALVDYIETLQPK
jgi:mono/diheme cytochrome c family protein